MKIVVYADVHGNKYALENLMKTDDYKNADLRVFLGDAINMCPYPDECIDMIKNSGDIFLLGNHEIYSSSGIPYDDLGCFDDEKLQHIKYMAKKISKDNMKYIKALPKEYVCEVEKNGFYFVHYPWETDEVVFDDPDNEAPPTIKTANLFANIKQKYVFFGHSHKPSIVKKGNQTFVCVGTLGVRNPGNYVLVEADGKKVKILPKQIYFDYERLKREVLEENYPFAKEYIRRFED